MCAEFKNYLKKNRIRGTIYLVEMIWNYSTWWVNIEKIYSINTWDEFKYSPSLPLAYSLHHILPFFLEKIDQFRRSQNLWTGQFINVSFWATSFINRVHHHRDNLLQVHVCISAMPEMKPVRKLVKNAPYTYRHHGKNTLHSIRMAVTINRYLGLIRLVLSTKKKFVSIE